VHTRTVKPRGGAAICHPRRIGRILARAKESSTSVTPTGLIIPAIIDKLGLGTAQFGLAYGVTNARGRVPEAEAVAIIDAAIRAGIRTFDTAAAYGDSEAVLGRALAARSDVKVVSKLPPLGGSDISASDIDRCRQTFEQSLARLQLGGIHGLLLHHPDDLRKPGAACIADFLTDLKRAGKIAKIGVSVYERAQIDLALDRLPLDLVQVPVNLLDQRLLQDGTLASLKRRRIEIHARSVFLQGTLLAEAERLPAHFAPHLHRFAAVAGAAGRAGLSRQSLCLRFILEQPDIDCAIVGVTSLGELQQIVAAARDATPLPDGLGQLAGSDAALFDPSRWPPSQVP